MKIKEFIEELEKFDVDSEIAFSVFDEYEIEIENVEFRYFDKSEVSKTIYIELKQGG